MTVSMNRLGNSRNSFQGPRKRILCVCSAGLLRSPTAAWVLSNPPFGFNTRAVGTSEDFALIVLDAVHVTWADEIVVMNSEQYADVAGIVKEFDMSFRLIHQLHLPDNFEFRDPKLVELMSEKFLEIFEADLIEGGP